MVLLGTQKCHVSLFALDSRKLSLKFCARLSCFMARICYALSISLQIKARYENRCQIFREMPVKACDVLSVPHMQMLILYSKK